MRVNIESEGKPHDAKITDQNGNDLTPNVSKLVIRLNGQTNFAPEAEITFSPAVFKLHAVLVQMEIDEEAVRDTVRNIFSLVPAQAKRKALQCLQKILLDVSLEISEEQP